MNAKRMTMSLCLSVAAGLSMNVFAQVNVSIGDLPDGKAIIISHSVTIDNATTLTSTPSQGLVSGSNFADLLTDDPRVGGASDPTVTTIQQRPTLANLAKEVTEDIAEAFAIAEFDTGFDDLNAGDILQVVRITSLPTKGVLRLGATDILTVPTDILRASIGNLTYNPDEDEFGADSFGWNASDGVVFAGVAALVNLTLDAINDAPDAIADMVERYAAQSVKIPVASLLANDSDAEGNVPLVLTGINYTGGNGALVSLAGSRIFYNPNGHTGADTFEYTVEDSLGASSQATVTITVIVDNDQSLNVTQIEPLPDGSVQITFYGIPGRTYRVQSVDSLPATNWVDRLAIPADGQGKIIFIDPPVLPPQRMYRTVYP